MSTSNGFWGSLRVIPDGLIINVTLVILSDIVIATRSGSRKLKVGELLKTESLNHYHLATREQADQVVGEYIEVFYNRIWRHEKIDSQESADFAAQDYASKKKSAG